MDRTLRRFLKAVLVGIAALILEACILAIWAYCAMRTLNGEWIGYPYGYWEFTPDPVWIAISTLVFLVPFLWQYYRSK